MLDPRHAPRWPALLGSLLCAGVLAGCTECPFPPPIQNPPAAIVLTFDDGPLPGDLARPPAEYSADELLQPLRAILDTLERNNATAVFFIQGPGEETLDAEGGAAFATALREMYDGGHTLGYHAYHADPAIWIRPCLFPPLAALPMSADLDRLVAFLDAVALPAGLEPDALFTPVFRQPFGGAGVSRVPAFLAAAARGWTYRGFRIDSADWAQNTDSFPIVAESFAALSEAQYVEYVVQRLQDGLRHTADELQREPGEFAVIDVLFHVNSFTAAHLQTWVDTLQGEYQFLYGMTADFAVPEEYVRENNFFVDLSVVTQLPAPPGESRLLAAPSQP